MSAIVPQSAVAQVTNTHPAWSPAGEWIAFDSDRSGEFHVYLVRPDGSELRRVTPDGANHSHPAWSPDGTALAFESDRSGQLQVWVIGIDGEGLRRVTSGPRDGFLATWSPDGTRIAYESRGPEGSDVYVVPVDGGEGWPLAQGPGYEGVPRWAPTDDRVAFDQDVDGKREVWVAAADGNSGTRPLLVETDWVHVAAWHPNGGALAATMRTERDPGDLYLFDLGTDRVEVLSSTDGWEGAASWSPDGSELVFQRNGPEGWELLVLHGTSGVVRALLPATN